MLNLEEIKHSRRQSILPKIQTESRTKPLNMRGLRAPEVDSHAPNSLGGFKWHR